MREHHRRADIDPLEAAQLPLERDAIRTLRLCFESSPDHEGHGDGIMLAARLHGLMDLGYHLRAAARIPPHPMHGGTPT